VLRDVPDNSTVVGVPGHIVLREGQRVVIIDPKQINDPLSEALSAVANEVKLLKDDVCRLQGRQPPPPPPPANGTDKLQQAIEMDYQI
jgi:serine O-acetyltransferase